MSIYTEIRQHLEALAARQPGALDAAQAYLRQHCRGCGAVLPAEPKGKGGAWCARCALPEAQAPAPPSDASHSADPAHWPAGKVQETVRRVWAWPEVQALLSTLEGLGVTLPISDADGSPASLAQRQQLYERPEAMSAIVQAKAGGVGVRHLAALLFATTPGGYSDEISRKLKEVAPDAAAAPSRHTSAPVAALARAHQPQPPAPPRQRTRKAQAKKPPRVAKPPREKKPPRVAAPKSQRPALAPVDPAHPAVAWPANLQAQAHALWDTPAAVQLRSDLAALGLTLPFPRGAARHVPLARADVRDALARAYRAGLHLRALAILALGSAPGGASDEIGKVLDRHDPTIRAKPEKRSA